MKEAVEQQLRAHAEAVYPEECVGVLLADESRVVASVPLTNQAADRRSSFSVAAKDYLAAEREAERRGLRLRGLYHSHPDAPAVPSASDLQAAAPGLFTVIVPVLAGRAAAPRSFWFDDSRGRFVEQVLS